MAKSKSGGTRSYIRGRVGADVYSIGRDAKGAKQQVVRSLAETVANPQTVSQMRGRMIMSTVMQAVSALRPIIDHSFDNVPAGQPSISEFISRNYALIKADVAAHPANNNSFSLVPYGGKGMQTGKYIISSGEATAPSKWSFATNHSALMLPVGTGDTFADLKTAWGLSTDEYVTILSFVENDANNINAGVTMIAVRYKLKSDLDWTTVITSENIADAFEVEGDATPKVIATEDSTSFSLVLQAESVFYGYYLHIITRNVNGAFIHSTCEIDTNAIADNTANVVLPTYPVGTQMFLNGGDI